MTPYSYRWTKCDACEQKQNHDTSWFVVISFPGYGWINYFIVTKIQTHFSLCFMNDPMAPSILRIASIKPRCWLLTASAAWSAPMTVILVWGNYPGMLHPVPGASGVCPSCPRPSADVRRAQEVAGDQQIENSLAPKLLLGEVISKCFILTESCLCVFDKL